VYSPESSNYTLEVFLYQTNNVGRNGRSEFVGHYIADSYSKVQPTSATLRESWCGDFTFVHFWLTG